MTFFSLLSADDTNRYFRIITQAVGVKRHFDLLVWLQGDVQAHIPHDILVAGWGDYEKGLLSTTSFQISRVCGRKTSRRRRLRHS